METLYITTVARSATRKTGPGSGSRPDPGAGAASSGPRADALAADIHHFDALELDHAVGAAQAGERGVAQRPGGARGIGQRDRAAAVDVRAHQNRGDPVLPDAEDDGVA